MYDLADLALEFHQQGKQLRIATKYPRLLRRHLFDRGINYFTLVPASGALEAAPAAGYADLIADLTATGATLREKPPQDSGGGHHPDLPILPDRQPHRLGQSRGSFAVGPLLDGADGSSLAGPGPYFRLTGNVPGDSPEQVSATILAHPQLAGLRGPTVARVYNVEEEDWFSISLLVKKDLLMEAVDHLRDCGGVDIAASQVSYLFKSESAAFRRLFEND